MFCVCVYVCVCVCVWHAYLCVSNYKYVQLLCVWDGGSTSQQHTHTHTQFTTLPLFPIPTILLFVNHNIY